MIAPRIQLRFLLCLSLTLASTTPTLAQGLIHTVTSPDYGHGDHGKAVAMLGDVTGDGYSDFAIGEPMAALGRVRVISGIDGIQHFEIAGSPPHSRMGTCVANVGDIDGDGISDVASGGIKESGLLGEALAGKLIVASGATGSIVLTIYGATAQLELGRSVASVGDIDIDGVPDLLIGYDSGGAGVYSGASGALLRSHTTGIQYDRFGWNVARVGDLDGDLRDDYAISDPVDSESAPGYVNVYSSATGLLIRQFVGDSNRDRFGLSVAQVPDVDSDSVDDLLIGAPQADHAVTSSGTAWLLSGATGAVLMRFDGPISNGEFGYSVGVIGDLTSDGLPEYAIGAPSVEAFAFNDSGIVRVIDASDGTTLYTLAGSSHNARFGHALAVGGDVNLDGVPDIVVGAPDSSSLILGGEVFVHSGDGSIGPANYCTAKINSQGCTPSMQWVGTLSISGSDDFELQAVDVLPGQPSLFYTGFVPNDAHTTFGVLCVDYGISRSPVRWTTSTGGGPCDGFTSTPLTHAYLLQHGIPAGVTLYTQCWYRDPLHADGSGVGLTDALRFTIYP